MQDKLLHKLIYISCAILAFGFLFFIGIYGVSNTPVTSEALAILCVGLFLSIVIADCTCILVDTMKQLHSN